MTTAPRPLTFRLFVRSTLSHMKRAREVLQARVFPKLRDHCKARGANFQAVDLRWGITKLTAANAYEFITRRNRTGNFPIAEASGGK